MDKTYEMECHELCERLQAKSVIIIAVDPKGREGQLVCGGSIDLQTALRLLSGLTALRNKIENDLGTTILRGTASGKKSDQN